MRRVLMNNCGSQAVEIIKLLHKDDNCVVYLSGKENKEIKEVADVYLEDKDKDIDINEYIDFLIKVCMNYNIDVFLPFRRMDEIVDYKTKFLDHNIKVMVPSNSELFKLFNSKGKTYEYLKEDMPEYIPEYYLVDNYEDLKNICEKFRDSGRMLCMKYVKDISSNSFRIISFEPRSLKELEQKGVAERNRIAKTLTYDDILCMFKDGFPRTLMLMEYLNGYEVSCDCIRVTSGDNIIIPRFKLDDKHQEIRMDREIIDICNLILNKSGYDTICNIQFKYLNGKPMLLELNTRMSGGVMISSFASNINLPAMAVRECCGEKVEISEIINDIQITSRKIYDIKIKED